MIFFMFIQISKEISVRNSGDPDQTAASDLVLHCLSMSHKKEARIIWVNPFHSGYW